MPSLATLCLDQNPKTLYVFPGHILQVSWACKFNKVLLRASEEDEDKLPKNVKKIKTLDDASKSILN